MKRNEYGHTAGPPYGWLGIVLLVLVIIILLVVTGVI